MRYGAQAYGRKLACSCRKTPVNRRPLVAGPVNVIDSIIITSESDTSQVLAQWLAYDPAIAVYGPLATAQSVKLFVNWSDRNGTIDLRQGDFFSLVVPDIFVYDYITDISNAPISNESGDIVATYSIQDNSSNMKEITIIFTDYVENHSNIFGNFWMLLYVGSVSTTEQKNLEFIINDNLAAQGSVTVNPNLGVFTPRDHKEGFSSPQLSVDGYYIFEWLVFFNMTENELGGFHNLPGFAFIDNIPATSPHAFLTAARRQQLGLAEDDFISEIAEYHGADLAPPATRYQIFLNHYNGDTGTSWYNFVEWHNLRDGLSSNGIDNNGGLQVSNIEVDDKNFSAQLGTITRPTILRFYTIATIRLSESALGDSEVAELFEDTFQGSYGDDLHAALNIYRFEAGGSAQGISGDYSFAFHKVDALGNGLPGAMFALFSSEDFTLGADRFVTSGTDGLVAFQNLPAGTFYIQETLPPYGYPPHDTIYKVELTNLGFEIYYGPNFEYRLSEQGNRIVNGAETELEPLLVILPGRKNLSGQALEKGAFHFLVKNSLGQTVASGSNDEAGNIYFSSLQFTEIGSYDFTIAEVPGGDSDISYDGRIFHVTVQISLVEGQLAAQVIYPEGGIVFNNQLLTPPCPPCPPCPPYPPHPPYPPYPPAPPCTCRANHPPYPDGPSPRQIPQTPPSKSPQTKGVPATILPS